MIIPVLAPKLIDSLAGILLLTALLLVGSKKLVAAVRIIALQSLILALLVALVAYFTGVRHILITAALTVVVKAVAIPYILLYVIKKIGVNRDIEPYFNFTASMLIATGLVVLAYYVSPPLGDSERSLTENGLPVSIAMVLIGFFVMISRKKAVTQILGLMVMENGLFLAALATTQGMPLVVELGVFFDILVGVLIMGIFSYKINRTFHSIDTGRLNSLKG
ncbi:MAG: NADH-quinone oxidoreductase subunit K [Syntrophothermus sp.]